MRYMKKYAKSPFAATKNVPLCTRRKSFGLRHGKHASEKRFFAHIATDISPVFRPQTHKYPSKRRLTENISEITKISRQMQQKD